MVEKSTNNNDGSANTEPKKRSRLFGSRRAAKVTASAEQPPQQPEVPEAADPLTTGSTSTAPASTAPASTAPASTAPAKAAKAPLQRPSTSLLFQAPDLPVITPRVGSRDDEFDGEPRDNRAPRNPRNERSGDQLGDREAENEDGGQTTLRRRSRRRAGDDERDSGGSISGSSNPTNTVVKVRSPRPAPEVRNEPTKVRGSTRLEAKKMRRRDGRDAGRRRPVITEAEFLARRESVDRTMVVRSKSNRIQIGVLEDGVLVEHYVAKSAEASLIGNVYLGRVQNVLPSMEAAFVDIGRGRNAVLYSGEVDWEAAAENSADGKSQARRIELALKPGDKVLVQVTKDPVGHKGARLTSQVSLPGRYLVYVPNGSMNGISRKLPDTERARLKKILKEVLPENVGVIVRTAAEGATDEQLTLDVSRLTAQWAAISATLETVVGPALLHSEPDLLVKIVRDVFNEDFHHLVIDGDDAKATITSYLTQVAPDLVDRLQSYSGSTDSFDQYRITEQIVKALDRKVWLPSGGSLVIDRTEAMTVVDVNTGKFIGSGGNLEETVTKNNLEAAEEIVRQLRLRDIGGIIVVDFIDMVLESNRDLVLRRLVECLSRDRTKHQVAEVTSLGLVQMTRKKLGLGLIESFSEPCELCVGRGIIIHHEPGTSHRQSAQPETPRRGRGKGGASSGGNDSERSNGSSNGPSNGSSNSGSSVPKKLNGGTHAITDDAKNALAQIAASTIAQLSADERPVVVVTQLSATDSATKDTGSAGSGATDSPASERPAGATRAGNGARQRNGGRRAAASAQTAQSAQTAHSAESAETAQQPKVATEVAAVSADSILEIPVKTSRGPRRISNRDAEQLLDSVLDALPEPKQPGQGRSRVSRRASSAGTAQTSESGGSSTVA